MTATCCNATLLYVNDVSASGCGADLLAENGGVKWPLRAVTPSCCRRNDASAAECDSDLLAAKDRRKMAAACRSDALLYGNDVSAAGCDVDLPVQENDVSAAG